MKQITNSWLQSLLKKCIKVRLVGQCHDCKQEVIIDIDKKNNNDYSIVGGCIWKYDEIENPFFKCLKCLEANPKLTNYRPIEVWSRVVGYLRPVKTWNPGKKEEFKKRKIFKDL